MALAESWTIRSYCASGAPVSASTKAFHQCSPETSSISRRHARRRERSGRQPDEARVDGLHRDAPVGERGGLARPALLTKNGEGRRGLQLQVCRGGGRGAGSGLLRALAAGGGGDVGDEAAAGADHRPVGSDADVDDPVLHVDAAVLLLQVDVGHPVVSAGHLAAHHHLVDIRAGQPETSLVLLHVVAGHRGRLRGGLRPRVGRGGHPQERRDAEGLLRHPSPLHGVLLVCRRTPGDRSFRQVHPHLSRDLDSTRAPRPGSDHLVS